MNEELNKHEDVAGQEETQLDKNSRRDFLKQGTLGLAGLAGAAALGMQTLDADQPGNACTDSSS